MTTSWLTGVAALGRSLNVMHRLPLVKKVLTGDDSTKVDVCVYFPGDVQDIRDNMLLANPEWVACCYERTCEILSEKFPQHHIILIAPTRMYRMTYAGYDAFVESNLLGAPKYATTIPACAILCRVIKTVLEQKATENDVFDGPAAWNKTALTLVGFSKGCVVLNKLVLELNEQTRKGLASTDGGTNDDDSGSACQDLFAHMEAVHWLDSGHSGKGGAWLTARTAVECLLGNVSRVGIHTTSYQIDDPGRPWIGEEKEMFATAARMICSRSNGTVSMVDRLYLDDAPPSLQTHFELLNVWDPTFDMVT